MGFVPLDAIDFVFGSAGAGDLPHQLFTEPEPGVFEVDGAMKLTDFDTITNSGIDERRMTTIGGV